MIRTPPSTARAPGSPGGRAIARDGGGGGGAPAGSVVTPFVDRVITMIEAPLQAKRSEARQSRPRLTPVGGCLPNHRDGHRWRPHHHIRRNPAPVLASTPYVLRGRSPGYYRKMPKHHAKE